MYLRLFSKSISLKIVFQLILFSCPGFFNSFQAQLISTPGLANFFQVDSKVKDSITVTFQNQYSDILTVTDINFFHAVFSASDTAFSIPSGGSRAVTFYCDAIHNLNYMDFAMVESSSHPGIAVQTYASVTYPGTYYNSTQNKSHEDLKLAVKTMLATGFVQLSYNMARDSMYMKFDNQRVNGQGAAQNTIECVYTGRTVVGYVNRSDAQSSGGFDTEHTFPQSFFSSNLPMLSDVHHLYPTFSTANNERGNNPFGIVSSPTWTDGGSKSNGSTFEPRNFHKGKVARALFYMVLRYQDYSGFVQPQEALLRTWCNNFPPDAIDSSRNEGIYGLQNNRNPLIDHPEFLDRIASICTVDSGPLQPRPWNLNQINFGYSGLGTPVSASLPVSNQGNRHLLHVSGFSFSDPVFSFVSPPDSIVKSDSLKNWAIQFLPAQVNQNYSGTLTFTTDDPTIPLVTVLLNGTSIVTGLENAGPDLISLFPNPTEGRFDVEGGSGDFQVFAYTPDGKTIPLTRIGNQCFFPEDASGIYLVKVENKGELYLKRIIVIH